MLIDNLAILVLAGFVGFYAFARRALELPVWCAALGSATFTVSNNSYIQGPTSSCSLWPWYRLSRLCSGR